MTKNNNISIPRANRTLEEKDKAVIEEIRYYGFIKNEHLVEDKEVPRHESIEYEYKDGTVMFSHLPEKTELLCIVPTKERPLIFTEFPSEYKLIYPEILELKDIAENVAYDLNKMTGNPESLGLSGMGKVVCANSICTPNRFREIKGSFIDVILLKNGNIRVDLINLSCETITFVGSSDYDGLDILLDDEYPKLGGIFLTGIRNGLRIHHPALAQALKHMAEISIIDRNEGRFYGHVMFFYCPEEYGERFVGLSRAQGESTIKRNIEMLTY